MPRKRAQIRDLVLATLIAVLFWAGCDSDISGELLENQPPNTELAVRDSSLVENLAPRRLTSTVFVAWSGTDPDGFVSEYQIRFYSVNDANFVGPEDGWATTIRLDSLVLLPIDEGGATADVVFEARAVDNEGTIDPTPARTVFPIVNSPPTIRFNAFELPPDTTFPVISMSWVADDPEGIQNLARIEVSFNDTVSFVGLPPETEFASFVANVDGPDRNGNVVSARVHLGRGFETTDIFIPGLRLDEDNVISVRAVDQTDTTSTRLDHETYVWEPKSDVLFVNDYRKSAAGRVQAFHLELLESYLPAGKPIDIWNLSMPFFTGNTGNLSRSEQMPPVADPTIRQFLALYRHIYWVATNTTTVPRANNFPFAASVMDLFFENGGTMMMHSPVGLPAQRRGDCLEPRYSGAPTHGLRELPRLIAAFTPPPSNGNAGVDRAA